jgi:hypothetical protein
MVILCLTLSGCTSKRTQVSTLINDKASLHGDLPFNPFQWSVISSFVNAQESTMSTLYGNDLAVRHARTDPHHPYPVGSVLSLITWGQQEDEHWFGAKIPGQLKSIEFVRVDSSENLQPAYSYQSFAGSPLEQVTEEETNVPNVRMNYVLSQRALVMP